MIKKFKDFLESVSFPTSEDQIVQLCKQFRIQDYSINPDLSIDVDGHVHLSGFKLRSLPLKFSRVGGYFDCSFNQLTSLEGCPREVGGNFSCTSNQITSLKGSPIEVGGYFYCSNNQLTTLEGSPREVGGGFSCRSNPVYEILCKFLDRDRKKVLKFWDDFDVVRNGNEVSSYRFKELYLDVTGEEFKGDLEFKGYRVVE